MQNKDSNRVDPTNSSGVHGDEGTPVHVQLVIVKEAVLEGWVAALTLRSWSDAVWSQIKRIEWLRVKNKRIRCTHCDVRGSTVVDRSFDIVCCWDTNGCVTLDHAWPEPSIWLAFGRALDRLQGSCDRATSVKEGEVLWRGMAYDRTTL